MITSSNVKRIYHLKIDYIYINRNLNDGTECATQIFNKLHESTEHCPGIGRIADD